MRLRRSVPWLWLAATSSSCVGQRPASTDRVHVEVQPVASQQAKPREVPAPPRGLACGNAQCDLTGRQLCCTDGAVGRCLGQDELTRAREVVLAGFADGDEHSPAVTVMTAVQACSAYEGVESALDCVDSTDCENGMSCCDQYSYSGGPTVQLCAHSCDFRETCSRDSSCRTEGTVCINGSCRKPPHEFQCGSRHCSRATPICCEHDGAYSCAAADGCDPDARHIECRSARDCAGGQACQRNVTGNQYCTGLVDTANAALLCERDGDCTGMVCAGVPGADVCDPEQGYCTCETR